MASFVFQLQTVLQHRERVEHDRQRELAAATAGHAAVAGEIRRLDEAVKAALADLRGNHLVGVVNLPFLTAHRRFMLSMQRQGVQLMGKLQQEQMKVAAAQALLAEATKDRKIMEKLRERQLERWKAAANARERADADEVAMQMSFQQGLETDASPPANQAALIERSRDETAV
jgi:flagellar FliJ protein